jgi:hypothetical protein
MALEMDDFVKMKMLGGEKEGFSPYEQVKLQRMEAKRPSGLSIAGMVTSAAAVVGVVGVAAWATAKASEARRVAASENAGTAALLRQVTEQVVRDHNESITRDLNITNTITDTQSGSQASQLTASQIATNEATAQIVAGIMTGKYSENPQKVTIWQDAKPCTCNTGCGCGM